MQRYATIVVALGILLFAGSAQAVWQIGQQVTTDFTLNDIHGQSHSLFDYEGQCVFINFFTLT